MKATPSISEATTPVPHAVAEPAARILCQIGKLRSRTDGVEVDADEADRNSNRWVFDVEHDPTELRHYELEIIDYNTGKPKPGATLSPRIQPLNEEAARATIWTPDPDGFSIEVGADAKGILRYRVMIDATIDAPAAHRKKP